MKHTDFSPDTIILPSNIPTERRLLGGLILNDCFERVQEVIHRDLFYGEECRVMFDAIQESFKKHGRILSDDLYNKLGYSFVLDFESEATILAFELVQMCLALKQKYVERELWIKCNEMIMDVGSGVDVFDQVSEVGSLYDKLRGELTISSSKNNHDLLTETLTEIVLAGRDGELIGYDTGFSNLNHITTGWQKTDLIIVAGRPGMGKTTLAINFMNTCLDRNIKPMFFSYEMNGTELTKKILSIRTDVEYDKIRNGRLSPPQKELIDREANTMLSKGFYIESESKATIEDLWARCTKAKKDGGIDIVFVDYLQLLRTEDKNIAKGNRENVVSHISRRLKELARLLKIPVVALSQLNRSVETRGDKRPNLSDLRESGSIEQDADLILFPYRANYYNDEEPADQFELLISKNRNGALGFFSGKCDLSKCKFYDADSTADDMPF